MYFKLYDNSTGEVIRKGKYTDEVTLYSMIMDGYSEHIRAYNRMMIKKKYGAFTESNIKDYFTSGDKYSIEFED